MREDRPIPFYGSGNTLRDYTFVRDTVAGIQLALNYTASQYEVINLGNGVPVSLSELVAALGLKAKHEPQPTQPGDVFQTWADLSKARSLLQYRPRTQLIDGLRDSAEWLTVANRPVNGAGLRVATARSETMTGKYASQQ
jgi:UDP-glucuronate 4-epimerase